MGLRTLSCLLVMAFLVPAAFAQSTCDGTDPCEADCRNCLANEKVPDPEDCRGYYMCIDGSAVDSYYPLPFDCDDGEVFNFTEHDCVKGDSCEPCGTTTVSDCSYECPAATTTTAPLFDAIETDPVSIPSFYDCNSYYTCGDDGQPDGSGTCEPETPFFDGEKCQTDETKCCHCHAYCPKDGDPGVIADPLDCRGYYLCTTVDAGAVPTTHGKCNDGEYFDAILGKCSASAPCMTQCTNVIGADGCIEPFTCLEIGYFARCPLAKQCTPDYYHCTEATGAYQEAQSCGSGTVFHPDSHNCVPSDRCP
ncbi:peritrophin-48-like isoform X6 [Eriocheir sinensis]|uniref:peritrophin-48-like isoform X6 n=1 Tax=Eriocheir sinensis TaxID=95602 RepID=UPI0021C98F79|nr:peritrophin-48-like isoform X6 [Eriocheir sinensis]